MVVKINSNQKNYVFKRKAGRSLIEHRPIFSPNEESLVVIVENLLRVYNVKTGDCTRSLETETPVNTLVGIEFPKKQDYNLYGCSDLGLVITWTWENGAVLREVQLNLPVHANIIYSFNLIDENECFVISGNPSRKIFNLGSYSLRKGDLVTNYSGLVIPHNDIISVAIGSIREEKFAAIANGQCKVYFQNLVQPEMYIQKQSRFRVLSVAANQHGMVVYTDALGRVMVLRGNLFVPNKTAQETLHWHSLPLFAVSFTSIGNYLITGGMEKVLVKWSFSELAQKVDEKKFIPRLPGLVRFITTSNSYIAVSLSNNSIVIANQQMYVSNTILECGGLSSVTRSLGSKLVYMKPLDSLIIPGRTGFLQLYSTATDKVLYNIDITETNSIPAERYNITPIETEVTTAAVSANGQWLVTSEYRNDGTNYPEEKLKFWSACKNNACPFILNTCVNLSHGGCDVVSIALSNNGDFCVTSGNDQKFRIWKVSVINKKKQWSCLTACYYSSGVSHYQSIPVLNEYKHSNILGLVSQGERPYLTKDLFGKDEIRKVLNVHKATTVLDERIAEKTVSKGDLAMGGVAISQDGSLIAAWFGAKLTLWDSHLCNLRTTLSHVALRPKGVHVHFGNHDAAHYLVCTTEECLAVWSLLSLTVTYIVRNYPVCLAADPFSNRMVVVTRDNDVHVFTPHNSSPILSQKRVLEPSTGVITHCTFGKTTEDDAKIYFMRNYSEIYCLEPEKSTESQLEVISHRNVPKSKFGQLLAEQQVSEVTSTRAEEIQQLNVESLASSAVSQFLSAAPHMIPPVRMLSTSFLQLISGYTENEEVEPTEAPMEVDSSDDEEAPKVQLPKPEQLCKADYDSIKNKKLKKILDQNLLDSETTMEVFSL
ncbi:WD repeat-containing protein 75 [Pieris napi]|uniref:WD repeat-containing protein 75 n=1 Tax=Pieris napi TaxID=78633 RepID=UPI001FB94E9D|nr:WD repeat-containing protein 75 [Pieris napi]